MSKRLHINDLRNDKDKRFFCNACNQLTVISRYDLGELMIAYECDCFIIPFNEVEINSYAKEYWMNIDDMKE